MPRTIRPTPPLPALHECWFGAITDGLADDTHRRRWFRVSPAFDALLASRFGDWPQTLAPLDVPDDVTPQLMLAWILVMDQLPRNVFRGTARAFAFDPLALRLASRGLDAGMDAALGLDERAFFRMPFMHSESAVDQSRSMALFAALHEQAPAKHRDLSGAYLRSAQQHHDIIARFGRFPHRNVLLGRNPTAAELDWLRAGSRRFGQAPPAPG